MSGIFDVGIYSKTDWALLAEQKGSLMKVIDDQADAKVKEHLDGILNFLDSVQDDAESRGYAVFPVEDLLDEDLLAREGGLL